MYRTRTRTGGPLTVVLGGSMVETVVLKADLTPKLSQPMRPCKGTVNAFHSVPF